MSTSAIKLRVSPALHSYLRRAVFGPHQDGHVLNLCTKPTFTSHRGTKASQNSSRRRLNSLCHSLTSINQQYSNHPTTSNISSRDCALSSSSIIRPSSFSIVSRRYYAEPVEERRRGFFRRLPPEAAERKKNASSASSRYLDPLSEKSILGRSFTLQNHGDVMLRCTEFDSEGKVIATSRDFKKMELCTQHGLLPRDLRKLESSVIVPHILVRKNSILINLLHIRALIKADAVLLFDVYGSTDSHTQSVFMYDLQGKLQSGSSKAMGGLAYEFRALESILISVTSALEAEMRILQDSVVKVLSELEEDIDRDKLRFLLIYSKKLSTFEQKAKLIRDAIDEVLEADDDLAGMYLSEKLQGIERDNEEHAEAELLLESYYKVTDEIVQISGNLVSNIRNTEDIVNIILDANRNSLMLLDLKFSIGTLGIGSGAFIAALYGMNLKNFLEESDFAFVSVSAWAFIFSGIICAYGLHKLRRTQRLSMWGEGGRGRKWWGRTTDRSTSKRVDQKEISPPIPTQPTDGKPVKSRGLDLINVKNP